MATPIPPSGAPTEASSSLSTSPYAPAVLPPSLYVKDPTVYCRLLQAFNRAVGLAPADRLVLGGVFQHLPVIDDTATTELLDRVHLLDATNLKLLANLFTAGLLDARSWGGSRTASTRSRTGTPGDGTLSDALTTNAEYSELFRLLDISSPFPPPQPPTERDPTTKERVKRTAKLSRLCLERQHDECPLTADTDIALETAHLIPFSIASPRRADTAFWLMLVICLGPALRDHLHSIVHGKNAATTVNALAMQSVLHKYFDRGAIALEPDLPDSPRAYDSRTTTCFDVVFRWRDVLQGLRLRVTMLPLDPAAQVSVASNGTWTHFTLPDGRRIEDGDKFRLCTDDPGRLPLPHPFLLSLHARLWSMIQSAGLAETIDRKRKRLNRASERVDNGDYDEDEDEDDASREGRKRVHRPKTRSGTRTAKQPKPPAAGSTAPQPGGSAPNGLAASAPVEQPVPAQEMTFLEREYVAFRLGNAELVEGSDTDTDTDTDADADTYTEYDSDSDSDSDAETTSSDNASRSGSDGEEPESARAKTFLEREWERFGGHRHGGAVAEEAV